MADHKPITVQKKDLVYNFHLECCHCALPASVVIGTKYKEMALCQGCAATMFVELEDFLSLHATKGVAMAS